MQECEHERLFSISAKVSDRFHCIFPNGISSTGYVPDIEGIQDGDEDYLCISICVDCHIVINFDSEKVLLLEKTAKDQYE